MNADGSTTTISDGISNDAYNEIIEAMIEIKEENLFREVGETFAATEGMIPYIKIREKLKSMIRGEDETPDVRTKRK